MTNPIHQIRRPASTHHWVHSIALVVAVAFSILSTATVSGFAPVSPSSPHRTEHSVLQATTNSESDGVGATRRETLSQTLSSLALATAAATNGFVVLSPETALAADTTRQEIISKLAGIPTFCLVNGPGAGSNLDGVPFDIYNTDSATATGYFFMSYETALTALKTASDMDSSRGDGNIWATAKIKVVPLSVALQLSLSKRRRVSVNEEPGVGGIKVDTIHNLIPSDEGNADAQTLDTSRNKNAKKWETKGRVPLFYIPEVGAGGKKDSYYFETDALINDYKRKYSAQDPSMAFIPEIQLVELIDIFRKAQQSNDWESLRDFVDTIQPLPEARNAAIKILKEEAASPSAPYNFDKVYLVVSAGKK